MLRNVFRFSMHGYIRDLSRSDGDDSVNDFLRLLNHADWAVVSIGRL